MIVESGDPLAASVSILRQINALVPITKTSVKIRVLGVRRQSERTALWMLRGKSIVTPFVD